MNLIEATLLLLFLTTVAVPWAQRLGLPREILLVIGSLAVSLFARSSTLILDPDVAFTIFLPPILFAAAYFTSWRDFKIDIRPILLLAFGLVLLTTTLVAVTVRMLGLNIPWAAAFLLGAIVAPPDASAAAAIIRKLGVPRRLVTILEGESLVNDATALVAYRISLAAILTGSFSMGDAATRFVLVAAGGIVVGLLIAVAGIFILRRLNSSTAETTLTLITAFAAYILAEHLGVSGVISTVAAGLYYGRTVTSVTSAQTHIEAEASWNMVLFIINGLVFTLIGLQLPEVIRGLDEYSWVRVTVYGVIVALVMIVIRFIWIFLVTYLPRRIFPALEQRDPGPSVAMVTALSWVGMRGIVSLAAAMSIPLVLPSGEPFPFRDLLIFMTYVVILVTLLIPSLTLPSLLRWLGIRDTGDNERDEITARLALVQAVLEELETLKSRPDFPSDLLENTSVRYKRRLETLQSNLEEAAFSPLYDEDLTLRHLLQRLLQAEREALKRLRLKATIHDEVFFQITRELDIEETRLQTYRV